MRQKASRWSGSDTSRKKLFRFKSFPSEESFSFFCIISRSERTENPNSWSHLIALLREAGTDILNWETHDQIQRLSIESSGAGSNWENEAENFISEKIAIFINYHRRRVEDDNRDYAYLDAEREKNLMILNILVGRPVNRKSADSVGKCRIVGQNRHRSNGRSQM